MFEVCWKGFNDFLGYFSKWIWIFFILVFFYKDELLFKFVKFGVKMKRSSCFKDNSIKVLWKLKIILGFKEILGYVNGGWFGDWFSSKVVFLNFLRNCFDFVYFIR